MVRVRSGYMPVNVIGDGAKLLLLSSLISVLPGVELLLMEEPESHMHPGYLRALARLMVEAAKAGRQLFVSTHSLELIEHLLEEVEVAGLVDVLRVIRMYWSDDLLEAELLSYHEVRERVEELGEDLRGM